MKTPKLNQIVTVQAKGGRPVKGKMASASGAGGFTLLTEDNRYLSFNCATTTLISKEA